jgi:5-methylthioadenosine/S-adenosylhomocysteine deaminase
MQTADTLIRGGLLVAMDAAERVIENAAIAISGGEIVALGPAAGLEERFQAAETIDASDHIVMPGLINAHTHMADSLFRSLVEDLALEAWLETLWTAERRFVAADTVRLGADLALAEMIRGGTTTALDMFFYPESTAAAAREVGFRLMTGPVYFTFGSPDGKPPEERTESARAWIEEWMREPLLVPCVQTHNHLTVSPEDTQAARALADEYGIWLQTHCSETATEVATTREQFGKTPMRHLADLGVLTGRTVLAHCVHLTDEDVALLAGSGAAAVHNPLSNLKLGSGIADIDRLWKAGVPVLLGTDGPVSSNDLDMWTAMRFAGLLQRGVHEDPTLTPSRDIVRMVTRLAAEALGLGEVTGSLEVGKRADLILIDTRRPHLVPMFDVYSHLVYAVGRDDVSTVLIDGRIVMRERQLLTMNEGATINDSKALAREIAAYMTAQN